MSYRTAKKPILRHRGRGRGRRPKTFVTEEAARKWAEANKMKDYTLENLHAAGKPKIRIVEGKS